MKIADIHCHILPATDDGADSMEEAKQMLLKEYEDGVRMIIATPHYRAGMFEPSMKDIVHRLKELRDAASQITPELKIYLGCEYHTGSRMTDDLKNKRRPVMAGSSYVLTEFSSAHTFERIRNQIYELVAEQYRPIIAHIERYPCLEEDIGKVEELKRLGAYIQCNASAVMGEYGLRTRKYCRRIMKEDLLDFIASDAHGIKHRTPNMGACAKYVTKKMGKSYADKIFRRNPYDILRDAKTRKELKLKEEES